MTDILSVLHEEFGGKYDFLRLGNVRLMLEEKKAFVTFLVPEDVYDYSMKKEDVESIVASVKKAVGGVFSVVCRFEKIILSVESVKSELIEYMCKHFPLIAANCDFTKVSVEIGDDLVIGFVVPQNIKDYMQVVSFDDKMIAHFKEKFVMRTILRYEIRENEAQDASPDTSVRTGRYGKSVEVTNKAIVMGKLTDLHGSAVHISTLKGEGEDVVCCGTISYLAFKTRDEKKKADYKRFFKHYYTFSIGDTTGYLNIFVNTDVELPALVNGAEVVVRGRVNAREDSNNFSMYAKAVATCKIPYSLISEQTKPLEPPEEYSILTPQSYHEVSYDQMGFDLLGDAAAPQVSRTASGVVVVLRSLKNERFFVPYEIALCEVEQGEIKQYMHTYFKVAFTDGSDKAIFANQKGYASPRLSTVIPDLVKFTAGKLLVGVNPTAAIDLLNVTAKPLRYLFRNDVHVIPQSALNGDAHKKGDALDEAVALAHIFIAE